MLYVHCHRLCPAPAPLRVSYNKLSPSPCGRGRGRGRPGCRAEGRRLPQEQAGPRPPGTGTSHSAQPTHRPGLWASCYSGVLIVRGINPPEVDWVTCWPVDRKFWGRRAAQAGLHSLSLLLWPPSPHTWRLGGNSTWSLRSPQVQVQQD